MTYKLSANRVKWIDKDIVKFKTKEKFDVWHDRAVFHFLTKEIDIQKYVELVSESVVEGGHFILGTFSVDGPKKCSGLEIVQYSEETVKKTFAEEFELIESFRVDHVTPSGSKQNFIFSHFMRK